jgi:hypothetical protein
LHIRAPTAQQTDNAIYRAGFLIDQNDQGVSTRGLHGYARLACPFRWLRPGLFRI